MNKIHLKIVTTRKQYLKWSFRPTFKREKQLCNGAIAIVEEILINQFILEQAF